MQPSGGAPLSLPGQSRANMLGTSSFAINWPIKRHRVVYATYCTFYLHFRMDLDYHPSTLLGPKALRRV